MGICRGALCCRRLFIENIKARHAIEHPNGLLGDENILDMHSSESAGQLSGVGGDALVNSSSAAPSTPHSSTKESQQSDSSAGNGHNEDAGPDSDGLANVKRDVSHEKLEAEHAATGDAREGQDDPRATKAVSETNSHDVREGAPRGDAAASGGVQEAPSTRENRDDGAVATGSSAETKTTTPAVAGGVTFAESDGSGNLVAGDASSASHEGHYCAPASTENSDSGPSAGSAKPETSLESRNEGHNSDDALSGAAFDVQDMDEWLSLVDFTISARDVIGSSWFASRQITGASAPSAAAAKQSQHVRSASASRQQLTIRLDLATEIVAQDKTSSVERHVDGIAEEDAHAGRNKDAAQLGTLREQPRASTPASQDHANDNAPLASSNEASAVAVGPSGDHAEPAGAHTKPAEPLTKGHAETVGTVQSQSSRLNPDDDASAGVTTTADSVPDVSSSAKALPASDVSSPATPMDAVTSSTTVPRPPDTKDGHDRAQSTVDAEQALQKHDSEEIHPTPSARATGASKALAQKTASTPGPAAGGIGSRLLRVEQKLRREAAAGSLLSSACGMFILFLLRFASSSSSPREALCLLLACCVRFRCKASFAWQWWTVGT